MKGRKHNREEGIRREEKELQDERNKEQQAKRNKKRGERIAR